MALREPQLSVPLVPAAVGQRVRASLIYFAMALGMVLFALATYQSGVTLVQLRADQVSLADLPGALFLSFLRMATSYVVSLLFAFVLGTLAARTRLGERLILPLLDILQSVPVVGFFPAAVGFFISVFHGHRVGIELAAIFLIFTSQAWNMAFSVYESIRGLPQEQLDAVESFGIRGWDKFKKLLAPVTVPRLVYNSILSWSNGWFFLVACEIIAVGPVRYDLPGIGSFLARSAEQDQLSQVLWGLGALTLLILTMDLIFWRPTTAWAERFKQVQDAVQNQSLAHSSVPSWVAALIHFCRAPLRKLVRVAGFPLLWIFREVISPLFLELPFYILKGLALRVWSAMRSSWDLLSPRLPKGVRRFLRNADQIEALILGSVLVALGVGISRLFAPPFPEIFHEIPRALMYSTLRLVVALAISLLVALPVASIAWNRPRLRLWIGTIAQIGASLPAIALFPLLVLIAVKKFGGGMEIASLALLFTGMFWYVLFNALGGAAAIPKDLEDLTVSLGLNPRTQFWKLVLPAIRPALVTGSITAWGGGWNALVVSEYVRFKGETLTVDGIGALINRSVYQLGDGRSIGLCLGAMILWIILINSLVWKPIYRNAIEKFRLA